MDDDKTTKAFPPWAVNFGKAWYDEQVKWTEKLAKNHFLPFFDERRIELDIQIEGSIYAKWPDPREEEIAWIPYLEAATPVVPETDRAYKRCIETQPRDGVPQGQVIHHTDWPHSVIYPGTLRHFAVYIPPGMTQGDEVALLCIPDGFVHLGFLKLPTVLDNMIHDKRLPPICAVFLQSGYIWEAGRFQRNSS